MYTLHNVRGWGSMGVQFLLEEMGIPYSSNWMTPEEVRSPGFRTQSPLGFIPALLLPDGRTLFESGAIFAYLAIAHPDTRLSPRPGTYDFGIYLSWLNFMSTNIYPVTNMAYGGGGYSDSEEQSAIIKRKASEVMLQNFTVMEEKLGHPGPYVLGKTLTALDLYLFMLSIWAMPSEAELHQRCKRIAKICATVRERPKLQEALAEHGVLQPGSYSYA
jgi:glutathione S-transferase